MFTVFVILLIGACYARDSMPDKTDTTFEKECIDASNEYRDKHHAPAFTLDDESMSYAKSRCQLISQYDGLSHGHDGLVGHGENLYWGGNSEDIAGSCKAAIDSWYDEVKDYDYNNPGFSSSTGHFTQLVWKGTTKVGCARCYGKGDEWYETYVVCNYKPAGNMEGDFENNVLPP